MAEVTAPPPWATQVEHRGLRCLRLEDTKAPVTLQVSKVVALERRPQEIWPQLPVTSLCGSYGWRAEAPDSPWSPKASSPTPVSLRSPIRSAGACPTQRPAGCCRAGRPAAADRGT